MAPNVKSYFSSAKSSYVLLFSSSFELFVLNGDVFGYLVLLTNVVLYGVEAHVCMKQTCYDLLERDYAVHLVIDACSSMNHHDRNAGI